MASLPAKSTTSATATHLQAQSGEPYNTYRLLLHRLRILPEEIILIIIAALLDPSNTPRLDIWLTATNLVKSSPLHAAPLISTAILRTRASIWASHLTDPAFSNRYWTAPGVASSEFSDSHPGEPKERQSDAERRRVDVFGNMMFLKGLALRVRALRRGEIEPVYLPRFRFDDYCSFYRGRVGEVEVMRAWWYYYDDGVEL